MPLLVEKEGSSRTLPLYALTIRSLPSASGTNTHCWLDPPLSWYCWMRVPLLVEKEGSSRTLPLDALTT